MEKIILKDFSWVSYDEERDVNRHFINVDDYKVTLYIEGEIIEWEQRDVFGFGHRKSSRIDYAEIGCRKERYKLIEGKKFVWQILERFKGFQHITLGLCFLNEEHVQEALLEEFHRRDANRPFKESSYRFSNQQDYEKYLKAYEKKVEQYLSTYSYPCTISFYKDYEKAFSPINNRGYHTGKLKKWRAEDWEWRRRQICDVEIQYKDNEPIYISARLDEIYIHLVELFMNNVVLSPCSFEETEIYHKQERDREDFYRDYAKEAYEDFSREMDEHDAWGNID